jgi:hypothetical protein
VRSERQAGRQGLAAIVIARQQQHRHLDPLQQVGQQPVFLGEAAIGEVAGDHQRIRLRAQGCDDVERALGQGIGLGDAIGRLASGRM